MSTGQGRARIEFEADASGVSNELITKMTATMDRIAAILEKGFSQGAAKAEASMGGVGTAAEQAGRKAEQAGVSAKKMGDSAAAGADRGKSAATGVSSAMDTVATAAGKAGAAALGVGAQAEAGARSGTNAASGLGKALDRAGESAGRMASGFKLVDATSVSGVTVAAQKATGAIDQAATSAKGLGGAFRYIDATKLSGVKVATDSLSGSMNSAARAAERAGSAASSSFSSASQAAGTAAASASRAGDAAGRAAGQMAQVGSSGRAGFEGASSAAQGLIGKLGGIGLALGAVMGPMQMLKGGFDRLMNLQRAEIMFQNVGLSAQETKDHMARLSEQVTGTSVSLADAAKYSAMFAQSGVEMGVPMDNSIKAFTSLAAIAEGSGVDVGRVLQQISANGTVTGEDLAQMSDAGVNASKYLADSMGIAQSDIKKAVSDGKVSFEDFVTAINHGTGDLAKQMGQTLPAKLSNLKTSVSSLGAFLIEPFIGPLTAMVEFSTSLFKNIKAPLAQMGKWLSGGSMSADLFKVAVAAIGSAAVVSGVMALARSIGLASKAAVFGAKVMKILSLSFLLSPIGLAVAAIGALVAGFVILWNKSEGFRNFFIGMWDGIVGKVTGVVDTLKAAWGEVTAVFTGGDDGYGAVESLIGTGAAQWLMGTLDNLKVAWGEITTAFNGGDYGYGALSALIGEGAAQWAITVIGNVKNAWGELTTAFQGGDDGYGALEKIIGTDAAEWAVNAVASVKTAWTELTTAFSGGDDGYGALEKIIGTDAAETVVNLIAGIGEGLRTGWELAKEFGTTLLDAIGPLLPVVGELLASLGGAMWETIKSLAGAFIDIAGSVWGLYKAIAPVLMPTLKVVAGILGGALFVAIKVLTGAFQLIAGVVKVAAGVFTWLIDTILTPLVTFLIDVVAGAFTLIVDVVTTVASGVQTAWDGLWGFLQAAWDTVGRPVLDLIVGAFQFWWDAISLMFRLMGAYYEVLFTGLGKAWNTFGQPIIDLIVAGFQMWWDGIKIIFGWLQSGWDLLWAGMRAVYDTVIAPVIGWVTGKFEELRAGIATAMDRVREVIQKVADKVAAFYAEYIQPMVDRVIRGFTRIVDTVTGWKDTIVGALAGAGTWLFDSGRNIVEGLIGGIKSLAGTIGSAFLNMVPAWIKDPFKKALGIASPSKVFAGFGANIGEGLIGGLRTMQGKVEGALGGITQIATEAGSELREAFTGGDSGYAALGTVIGDDLAHVAVNATAGVGGAASNAGIAATEMGTAFQGGDHGYGAAASLLGDDAGKAAVDVSAQIGSAFASAGDGINAAKTGLIDPAVAGMQQNLTDFGTNTQTQLNGVIVPAMNVAGAGIATAKATFFDPVHAGLQAAVTNTGLTTQNAMLGTVLPAVQTAGAGIAAVQTGTVDPALANMRGAVGATQSAFAAGAAGINAEWNRIRSGTADPARFVISTVFNDGIVGMWNSASELIGTDKMSPYPVRFATGGHVTGPGGPTDDKIPAWLSNNEYVLKASTVKKIGVPTLNALNAGAFTLAPGSVRTQADAARLAADKNVARMASRYAGGGVVEGDATWTRFKKAHDFARRWDNRPYVWGGSLGADGGTDCSGWVSSIADVVHGGSGLVRQWATGSFPGGGGSQGASGPQGFVGGLGAGLAAGVSTGHTAGTLGGIPGLPTMNIESGGSHGHTAYGGPAVGADHSQFPSQYHLGLPGLGMFRSGGGGGGNSMMSIVSTLIGEKMDAVNSAISSFRGAGLAGALPEAIGGKMRDATESMIQEKMMEFGGDPGGAGAERWRPMAMRAMAMAGFDPSNKAQVDAMIAQIASESGGNPSILQTVQDINSGGNEGMGLLQIIPGTFAANRDPNLPDDRTHPMANMVAALRYYKGRYGMDLTTMWGKGHGYDQGGIANGMGFLQKKIVDPERVLNPAQTKAFEAWMGAGQRFDEINDLMASVQSMQLDRPEVMADEIGRRVAAWVGDKPADGSLRALAGALQSGVEWERVTQGMQRSAEAWANGDWVKVGEDSRLATRQEMSDQVAGNFMAELSDELGGLIGLKGLMKAPNIVGESGLVTLPKDTADKLDAAVATPDGAVPTLAVPAGVAVGDELTKATRIDTATTTGAAAGTGKSESGEKVTQVNMTINVNGTQDPMAVSDQVVSRITRGLETAIGGTVRSQ